MSENIRFARIGVDVLHDPELSPIDKLVYCELALWAISSDRVSRGQRTTAAHLGISPGSVNEAIRQLEAKGHISRLNSGKIRGVYSMNGRLFRKSMPESKTQLVDTFTGHADVAATLASPTCDQAAPDRHRAAPGLHRCATSAASPDTPDGGSKFSPRDLVARVKGAVAGWKGQRYDD